MKKFAIIASALAVFTLGFAQTKPTKPAPAPKEIACAVMTGSKVNIEKATKAKMYADYKGRRYFFCCAGCPGAFKNDPAKYAKNASIKTPAAPKKK